MLKEGCLEKGIAPGFRNDERIREHPQGVPGYCQC
jgi:hypothetical protein